MHSTHGPKMTCIARAQVSRQTGSINGLQIKCAHKFNVDCKALPGALLDIGTGTSRTLAVTTTKATEWKAVPQRRSPSRKAFCDRPHCREVANGQGSNLLLTVRAGPYALSKSLAGRGARLVLLGERCGRGCDLVRQKLITRTRATTKKKHHAELRPQP